MSACSLALTFFLHRVAGCSGRQGGSRTRLFGLMPVMVVLSAANRLADKRMSKSRQMRWSHAGAHQLLQVRAEVIDGRMSEQFERWYPGFARAEILPAAA